MGDIYSQALKVHVWLGEDSDEEKARQIWACLKALAYRKDEGSETKLAEQVMARIFADQENDTLRLFLSRPWFQRRWVLQEVCLGHRVTVRYGLLKMPWSLFTQGITALASNYQGL